MLRWRACCYALNNWVFRKPDHNPPCLATKALELVNEVRATQEKLKALAVALPFVWKAPSSGVVKVNCVGAKLGG